MPNVATSSTKPALDTRPVYGPWRRKVTLACDACRKRRVKCSGTFPCNLCVENGRACAFDEKNRGRRGPRRRQPVPKVIRDIAPAPSIEGQVAEVSEDTQIVEASVESDNSDDEGLDGEEIPDFSTWRDGLATILFAGNDTVTEQDICDLELIGHLLSLLWHRETLLMQNLLPARRLVEKLRQGIFPRSLIYAICACTAKFSVHKARGGNPAASLGEKFENRARQEIGLANFRESGYSLIQTYCVLVEYSASKGNGGRAWIDIATARSILEVTRALNSQEGSELYVLKAADDFLSVKELCYCLGYPSLGRTRIWEESSAANDDSRQFSRLLMLLVRIQEFCQKPLPQHDPPPWKPNSEFQVVQEELRMHLIQRPGTVYFNLDTVRDRPTTQNVDAARCALAWHCCQIFLTRTFLPISERSKDNNSGHDATIRSVQFPRAPPLFLKEKIHSCEASAAAICIICKEIVASGQFFLLGPWLGFSCMQSAVVLVNQLHRSIRPYDETIVESLKLAFTILRLVASFYTPAHEWIECLFRVHDTITPLKHQSDTVDVAFSNYFSRFMGVREPSFITLEPREMAQVQDTIHDTSPRHASSSIRMNNGQNEDDNGDSSTKDAWLRSYTTHLAEDISDDEGDVVSQTKPITASNISPPVEPPMEPLVLTLGIQEDPADVSVDTANTDDILRLMPGNGIEDPTGVLGNGLHESWSSNLVGPHLIPSPGIFAPFSDFFDINNTPDGDGHLWSAIMDQILTGDGIWPGGAGK